ncbi:MAG TPA: AsmA-like C-terminal region-containing protein [Candidatus Wallbacteria bacterium]|nr:AsmA-like C-terminal region-containing protein [Candidatus Wallbacteria bacterium]
MPIKIKKTGSAILAQVFFIISAFAFAYAADATSETSIKSSETGETAITGEIKLLKDASTIVEAPATRENPITGEIKLWKDSSNIAEANATKEAEAKNSDTVAVNVSNQPAEIPGIATEIKDATVQLKQLKFPVTNISGKVKWLQHATEMDGVSFRLLNSDFKASGVIGKGSERNNFKVSSESVKFEDLKQIFPILSQFNIAGAFKLDCAVEGTKDEPLLNGKISLPASNFDFGGMLPELKGVGISDISAAFSYSKELYKITDFSFKTMDGVVRLSGSFNPSEKSAAALSFAVDGISVEKFSKFFDKYKGKLSGDMYANFKIKNIMTPETAYAEGTLDFKDGIIKDLEPLKKLGEKLKTSGMEELKYQKIGGNFKLFMNKKVDFQDFEILSNVIKMKTTGTIDENRNVSAKLFAELSGGNVGDKIKDNKFGRIFKKIVQGIKGNFIVSGSADKPKFDLDLGQ